MRKLLIWGSVVSGAVAAYMMYKRGESVPSIARKAITRPVGSLVHELRHA